MTTTAPERTNLELFSNPELESVLRHFKLTVSGTKTQKCERLRAKGKTVNDVENALKEIQQKNNARSASGRRRTAPKLQEKISSSISKGEWQILEIGTLRLVEECEADRWIVSRLHEENDRLVSLVQALSKAP